MTDAGWIDWAKPVAGVSDKVYSAPNSGAGIACHSVEGDDRIDDVPDRFLSREKDAAGRYTANSAASVMFINPREDGHGFIQMYPVTASTWTSGNRTANCSLWGVESEGFAGQPLTDEQVANMVRLCREWEDHTGKVATRGAHGPRTVWQHNEVWNWDPQNAGPTACPSGRYDGFFAELEARAWEEDQEEMPDPRVDKLIAALGGEAIINAWNANGNDLLTGYGLEQQKLGTVTARLDEHIANAAAGIGHPDVPDHTHEPGKVKR